MATMLATIVSYGGNLWVAALVFASVAPPLFFIWRSNHWRISLKYFLLGIMLIGPACLLLGRDLTHIDLAIRNHYRGMIHDPISWWSVCGLPTIALFLFSTYSARRLT
jgi:hypothetical protein